MWQFTHEEVSKQFRGAAEACGVMELHPCLYGLRHGGASHDRLMDARPLAEVQQRGGWRSHASVRRYEKHGMVVQELMKLPSHLRDQLTLEEPLAGGRFVACLRAPSAPLPGNTECSSSSSLGARGCRRT